eukprot:321436-Lingulodinium_polyedra.AAC.1
MPTLRLSVLVRPRRPPIRARTSRSVTNASATEMAHCGSFHRLRTRWSQLCPSLSKAFSWPAN